jgi:hypothetical protein
MNLPQAQFPTKKQALATTISGRLARQAREADAKAYPAAYDTRCHFLEKLPRELRNQIYGYVAVSENDIGLHVTLKEGSKPKARAYALGGLSETCQQVRAEYSDALQRRIKGLATQGTCQKMVVTETRVQSCNQQYVRTIRHADKVWQPPARALSQAPRAHIVRVAARRLSKGVLVQDDVGYTMNVPFVNVYDPMLKEGTLTLTFASRDAIRFNNEYILGVIQDTQKIWKPRGEWIMLREAAAFIHTLLKGTEWKGWEWVVAFWWKFDMMFPLKLGFKVNCEVVRLWMKMLNIQAPVGEVQGKLVEFGEQ